MFHAAAMVFVQSHSLWFSSANIQSAGINAPWLSLIEKKQRDQILKEAFEFTAEVTSTTAPQAMPSASALKPFAKSLEEPPPSLFSFQPRPFPTSELSDASLMPQVSFFHSTQQNLSLFEHLPKELILPLPAAFPKPRKPAVAHQTEELKPSPPPTPKAAPEPQIAFKGALLNSSSLTENSERLKATITLPLPGLPHLPTLAELKTVSHSNSFDAELLFLPKENGEEGYIFALTLIPRPDLNLPKIRQNYTFLIDRSNSIQKERLNTTKNAVHKALEEMYPDDVFNIVAFDSKMEKLSPSPLPFSLPSLATAEAFLEKIQLGSFFSQSNLYRPLFLTVPGAVQEDEIHTAILLTDAESLAKKADQRSLLADWTHFNEGKVALFVLSMKEDRHLGTLDTTAAFNRGKLTSAPSNRGLKRKLLKLMKTIHHPVAKNLACHAISRSANVQIYPRPSQMPHLYLDQPYVILGSTDKLDDFVLFLQGRGKDQWLNIKKTISFLQAKRGNHSLRAEWALQCAHNLYELYLSDDQAGHLTEAASLLQPYDFPPAFQ
jgi:hypothetical protein